MSAHTRPNPLEGHMSPAKAANYILTLEAKLGRKIDRATIRTDGGIDLHMAGEKKTMNPADLVDMTE